MHALPPPCPHQTGQGHTGWRYSDTSSAGVHIGVTLTLGLVLSLGPDKR